MTFQRARQETQKAKRISNIMTRARELCSEVGVMGWSLNELGRRADITKSNLYRYFGSREEILMVLMHEEIERFVDAFVNKVGNSSLSVQEFCTVVANIYDQNPLLCDLLSVSATILEQNTNLDSMREIKLANFVHQQVLAEAIESCMDDIDRKTAVQIAFVSGVLVMGLWPMASPQAPVRQLTKFEGLEGLALDFREELQQMLESQIRGLISIRKQ